MENNGFVELGLSEEVLRAIEDMGFDTPSDIQREAIPVLVEGHDLIGQAQTGTGKTLAFGAPILSTMERERGVIKSIIIAPTRELAMQVNAELQRLATHKKIRVTSVYGGSPIREQIRAIKSGVDIVVGTPGRILDLIRRKVIKLGGVEYLVLDEADEMLNMGFIDDIEEIIRECGEDRQTLLFSATMPPKIKSLAKRYMKKDSKHIKIAKKSVTTSNVKQYYFESKGKYKFETLCRILDYYNPTSSILFCNTKRDVDEVVSALKKKGYNVEGMHGDMTQGFRMKTLKNFRDGNLQMLVATDVAARGIDVNHVTHVINYGLPTEKDSYVHRIGRTGRANREGVAYTIITSKDKSKLKQVQRNLKCEIDKLPIPKVEDIFKAKSENIIETINQELDKNDNDKFKDVARQLAEGRDEIDVIATLLSMKYNDEVSYEEESKSLEDSGGPSSDSARIFINLGRKDNLTKRKLVKYLTEEGKLKGDTIKKITVLDKFSFFNMRTKDVDKLFKRCQGKKFCKRSVSLEIAKER